ncbi:60S ribosomal protein L28, partial [Serendipita vermifera]
MSTDLQWLLLRKNNSFMVKRLPQGPVFSSEPGNLMNLHSHKWSGLANAKTIQIDHNKGGGLKVVTRKPSAHPYQNSTGKHYSSIRQGSGPRRSAGIAAGQSKRGYRPDLRKAALARTSALLASLKEKPDAPPKKVRGKK